MRWLVVVVGCAACGRGFFNPQPHDGPARSGSQGDGILVEDTQCATSGIYAAITADGLAGNWVDEAIGLRAPQ